MKQYLILFMVLFMGLTGCKDDATQVKIKGEIKGLGNDTIFLYGDDELSDFIKAIPVADDKFSLSIDMDTTLIQTRLFINEEDQYPVYLERGKTIQIKGDAGTPSILDITGNINNEELTAFLQNLQQSVSDTLTANQIVEEYIRKNQSSLINIYLLDKYFVQMPYPDLTKIKQLIGIMDGALQDKPYIERLTTLIEENEKAAIDKTAPSFTLSNPDGKKISRTDFRDKYLLITFWASWCDSCKTSNKEIKEIYKTYPPIDPKKKNNTKTTSKDPELAILGISLDMDKIAWKDTIKQDTLKWEQVSDLSGWASPIVKQYAVDEIPYNILIDSRGRIISRGLKGNDLKIKLENLLKKKK